MSTTTKPNRRLKPSPTAFDTSCWRDIPPDSLALARHLALLADLHLQLGFHGSAELLARRAETVREAGQ